MLQGLYALTSTGRVHVTDEASALFQARSLPRPVFATAPRSFTGFMFYGERSRRLAARAKRSVARDRFVPFYALGKDRSGAGGPDDARDVVLTFAVVLSSAAFSAVAAALFLTLLIHRDAAARRRSSSLSPCRSARRCSRIRPGCFRSRSRRLLIGAALCAFGDNGPVAPGRAAYAGALVGACVLVRPAHALMIPIFAAAILVRDGRRGGVSALVLGSTAAIGLMIYLAWNDYQLGNPFEFGYPEIAGGKRINGFTTPLLTGLAGFLISPGKSFFVHAPLVLAAIPALPRFARVDRGLASLAIVAPLTYLFFYARYTQWEGGYCVGPRYLIPVLRFASRARDSSGECRRPCQAMVPRSDHRRRLVQSIGLATSFLEDQFGNVHGERFDYQLTRARLFAERAVRALRRFVRVGERRRSAPL